MSMSTLYRWHQGLGLISHWKWANNMHPRFQTGTVHGWIQNRITSNRKFIVCGEVITHWALENRFGIGLGGWVCSLIPDSKGSNRMLVEFIEFPKEFIHDWFTDQIRCQEYYVGISIDVLSNDERMTIRKYRPSSLVPRWNQIQIKPPWLSYTRMCSRGFEEAVWLAPVSDDDVWR